LTFVQAVKGSFARTGAMGRIYVSCSSLTWTRLRIIWSTKVAVDGGQSVFIFTTDVQTNNDDNNNSTSSAFLLNGFSFLVIFFYFFFYFWGRAVD